MKKLFFLAAVATAAMFSACEETAGSDDKKGDLTEPEVTKVYSFTSNTFAMSSVATVELELFDEDGKDYNVEEETIIPVVVDTEKSTAVEGENFEFAGDAQIVIPVGENKGSVKFNIVGDAVAEKNTFVIKVNSDDELLVEGVNNTATVNIFGSVAEKLIGTWKIVDMMDQEDMKGMWGDMVDFSNMPVFDENDRITFGGDFTTDLKSDLKNYFSEQSDMTFGEADQEVYITNDLIGGSDESVQFITLNNINRYFSAEETSEDNEAIIGVSVNEDGQLKLYLIDYESHSFAPELLDFYGSSLYKTEKPVANGGGTTIMITLEKVTE